ncbi:MAG: SIS domain-containing protein, partial [Fimbriimonadaceae bacterium]|nr:SIS domain-containing protein [Fimbriimonadaceae bacterium]
ATLTAIGNDYGYDEAFSRQAAAFCRPGDLLVAISTSGNSPNIVRAAEAARANGCRVLGMTGAGGGHLAQFCDALLAVPSRTTARVQEMHILMIHAMCAAVDDAFPA